MQARTCGLLAALVLTMPGAVAVASEVAPGAPGLPEGWPTSDKTGFGTATGTQSRVWFTLGRAGLTELYYPRVDIPSVRDLQFIVSDGQRFAERESDGTNAYTIASDARSLSYTQITVAKSGDYGFVKTYTTDPERATTLVRVQFYSFSGRPYHVYALLNPGPNNDLTHTRGETSGTALLASNGPVATAFVAAPPFAKTSNGYFGTSDGALDLSRNLAMRWTYTLAERGNVVQTGETALDGVQRTETTLAIGFGGTTSGALASARASLRNGFEATASAYAAGWHSYLATLRQAPGWLGARERRVYYTSAMVLAGSEDKTYRGAYVASPSMPWVNEFSNPSNVYHLVWARDLYQIATGLLAVGDHDGAARALQFLFAHQQKADGSFPQNSQVDGTPVFGSLQLDEVAFPIILTWQLRAFGPGYYAQHVKPAADFLVANGPTSPQERWEEQNGYSPSNIAAEIAALVCAAEIATRHQDTASAARYLATADAWRSSLAGWTVSTNGPLSGSPYYLRLTKDGKPNAGTPYNLGNSAPTVDQRRVADAGFLELVRLGVTPATDATIRNSLDVVDRTIRTVTPLGTFWHRYSLDGYGEQSDGSPWNYGFPEGSQVTYGRLWPLLSGERGEYELLAGQPDAARRRLTDMAATAKDTFLLSEQVWDEHPPSNDPNAGFPQGTPTTSATPLAWTHAQFLRLVRSIGAGKPIEQPSVVACRYLGQCGAK